MKMVATKIKESATSKENKEKTVSQGEGWEVGRWHMGRLTPNSHP